MFNDTLVFLIESILILCYDIFFIFLYVFIVQIFLKSIKILNIAMSFIHCNLCSVFKNVVRLLLKIIFISKYFKIIFFYFLKIIFNINISK